ncbi:MAG: DUF131 domain-containing protein [Candidatus Altiarchaeales archaeon]|nr:DUF131 domain-containing protein [Candidatus Altiarchaeales archaeon]MBD3417145.1 DUF131 domain-containing protein [Candidatus Altiarchaeales archaeon]
MDRLIGVGLAVILAGFMLVAAGVVVSALKGGDASVKGGGVLFIGPIPVVFGTDRGSAVAAAVIGLSLMVMYYLLSRR